MLQVVYSLPVAGIAIMPNPDRSLAALIGIYLRMHGPRIIGIAEKS